MGRVVRVHAGQEQVVRRQIDDHRVERRVRLQRHRQEGQPVPVRLRTGCRTRSCGRSALPRSRGRRRRARVAGRPAIGPIVPGAPASRPRSPRCSSRRSRGPRSRYSAMSIRSITTSSIGLVLRADRGLGDRLHDVVAVGHLSEDRVLAVQVRRLADGDEELRAVGAGPGVRHRQPSDLVERRAAGGNSSSNL